MNITYRQMQKEDIAEVIPLLSNIGTARVTNGRPNLFIAEFGRCLVRPILTV